MKQRRRVSHARNLPIRPAHADHHRGQHTRNGTVDHHHHEEKGKTMGEKVEESLLDHVHHILD
jgi:hypothetical protein